MSLNLPSLFPTEIVPGCDVLSRHVPGTYFSSSESLGIRTLLNENIIWQLLAIDSYLVIHAGCSLQTFTLEVRSPFNGCIVLEYKDDDHWHSYRCNEYPHLIVGPGRYILTHEGHEDFRIRLVGSNERMPHLSVYRSFPETPAVTVASTPSSLQESFMERVMLPGTLLQENRGPEISHFLSVLDVQPDDVIWLKCPEEEMEFIYEVANASLLPLRHNNLVLVTPNTVEISSLSIEDMNAANWYYVPDTPNPVDLVSTRLHFSSHVQTLTHQYLAGNLSKYQWIQALLTIGNVPGSF